MTGRKLRRRTRRQRTTRIADGDKAPRPPLPLPPAGWVQFGMWRQNRQGQEESYVFNFRREELPHFLKAIRKDRDVTSDNDGIL